MAQIYLFGDEAGNFDFSNGPGASEYWILGTVALEDPSIGEELLRLRRKLAWQGMALESQFHATTDKQVVRDQVFELLEATDFRFDCTILQKRKAQTHLRRDTERFYKIAWYYHFKHVGPRIVGQGDELLVVAATIGTKKRRRGIRLGLADVVDQSVGCKNWEVAFWPAESDPCLQIADYCTWAVQRKYERQDVRSYDLILDKISTEYDLWKSGTARY